MTKKAKAIIGVLLAAALIGLFGLGVYLIEKHGEKEEQFGDSGDWGKEGEETILSFGDYDYETSDSINAYLLIGTDQGGDDKGEGFNGELADFITLILMDNTTQKYGFYQIDRNTMVDVTVPESEEGSGGTYKEQICTAHWYGKTAEERNNNLVSAVSDLLGGLGIDRYYTLSMDKISEVNDAIGGVVVTIDTDMTDVDPAFKEGETILLNDGQAEKYLRARSSLEDDRNSSRMRRQSQYMQNAFDMVVGQLRENPEYINDLYDRLSGLFETDGSPKDISQVADRLVRYENMGFIGFKGKTEVNDTLGDGVEHEEFYIDNDSIVSGLRKVMTLKESE